MAIERKHIVPDIFPSGAIMYFYRNSAPSGWVICDGKYHSEDGTQSSATKTDVCTRYAPNLIGRYPLGSTGSIGGQIASGLPNIEGKFRTEAQVSGATGNAWYGGPFRPADAGNSHIESPVGGGNKTGYTFNAKLANSVYGKYDDNTEFKNKVIPDSTRLLPCMKL